MAKKKRKKRRVGQRTTIDTTTEVASTEPSIHPNATLGPDASLEPPSTGGLVAQDSTSAPEIGKESETEETYPPTQWAWFDRILRTPALFRLVLSLVFIVFIGWIIIQDNNAGKLTDWDGVLWALQKSGVFTALFVLILLFIGWVQQKILR